MHHFGTRWETRVGALQTVMSVMTLLQTCMRMPGLQCLEKALGNYSETPWCFPVISERSNFLTGPSRRLRNPLRCVWWRKDHLTQILSKCNDPYQTYLDLFGTYQGCKRFVWILFLCISTYLDQISPQLNLINEIVFINMCSIQIKNMAFII